MIRKIHLYLNTNNVSHAEFLSRIDFLREKYNFSYTAALMAYLYPPSDMFTMNSQEEQEMFINKSLREKNSKTEKNQDEKKVEAVSKDKNENEEFLANLVNEMFTSKEDSE